MRHQHRYSMWETIGNSSFWLGGRWTWEDFEDKEDGVRHPHLDDLYMSLPLTGIIILFRLLIQRCIFLPIGVWYGMKNRSIGSPHQPSPKKLFDDNRKVNGKQTFGHADVSNGCEVRMDNRFPQPRSENHLNALDRFTNLGWKLVFKSLCVSFEFYWLWNKELLWDIKQCWHGYPHQDVDSSLKWFICCQLAYFMCEIVLEINNPIRKDFLIMVIHHVCAVSLLTITWTVNLVRIFVLSLFAHDIADIFVQFEKMLLCMKHFVWAKYHFLMMFIIWISTRIVVYFKILLALKVFIDEFGLWGAHYFVFGMACVLFCLDVMWTISILKMMLRIVTTGRVENSKHAD